MQNEILERLEKDPHMKEGEIHFECHRVRITIQGISRSIKLTHVTESHVAPTSAGYAA